MARIHITDLNDDMTITAEEIKHVRGGAGYLKIGDIKGESGLRFGGDFLGVSSGFATNKATPILMFR